MPTPYQPKRRPLDPCPLEEVLALAGGKWKARILHALSLEALRFAELRRRTGPISQQVLSAQLAALIAQGLVLHETCDEIGLYRVTAEGRSLVAALMPAAQWGAQRIRDRGETPRPWLPP